MSNLDKLRHATEQTGSRCAPLALVYLTWAAVIVTLGPLGSAIADAAPVTRQRVPIEQVLGADGTPGRVGVGERFDAAGYQTVRDTTRARRFAAAAAQLRMGAPWQAHAPEMDGGAAGVVIDSVVYALAADDSTVPPTVYAGVYSVGMFKTVDGGTTWNGVNNGFNSNWIFALALDTTTTPATVFAGTSVAVFKSTNAGASWTKLNKGLPDTDFRSLAVDESTIPPTIYVSTYLGAYYGGGVFKSTNGGASWTKVNTGLPDNRVNALAVDDTTSPETVYAGTDTGLYLSHNNGSTWTAAWTAADGDLPTVPVRALAVDRSAAPATVFAGTGSGACGEEGSSWCTGLGVWKTTDGGVNWSSTLLQIWIDVYALAVDASTLPATLYVGAAQGIYKNVNGGTSWSEVNSGLPSNAEGYALAVEGSTHPGTVYAGVLDVGRSGVYKSTNGGGSWSKTGTRSTDLFISKRDGSLRYGPDGRLHQLLSRPDANAANPNEIVYRWRDPAGTWVEEVVSQGSYETALAVDSHGVPHLFRLLPSAVEHYRRDPVRGWQLAESVALAGNHFGGMMVEIGPGDVFHVLGSQSSPPRLVYGTTRSGTWQWELIEPPYNDGDHPNAFLAFSLAADSDNFAHLAFMGAGVLTSDPNTGNLTAFWSDLWYAANRTGTWQRERVAGGDNWTDFGVSPSIAVDLGDQPWIAEPVIPHAPGGGSWRSATLRLYSRATAGTWKSEVVASQSDGYVVAGGDGSQFTGYWPLLLFDGFGRPHIGFCDYGSKHYPPGQVTFAGQLRHAYRNQGRWRIDTVYPQKDPEHLGFDFPVLALSSQEIAFAGESLQYVADGYSGRWAPYEVDLADVTIPCPGGPCGPTPLPTLTPSRTVTPTPTQTGTPTISPTPSATPTAGPCYGDCASDGRVTVDELVKGVTIALGAAPLATCGAFDSDDNQRVTVDELVKAVNAALNGCVI